VFLRRRLNTVLLQWFLLLVLFGGTVWAISLPGIRRDLVDDRLLLARTVALAIDNTLSTAVQRLAQLAADLPDDSRAIVTRIRPFRFESIFSDAIYVVDADGRVIAADPPGVEPIDRSWLTDHEGVTPAIQKGGGPDRTVVAIVQPFHRAGKTYYLIAEMHPAGSRLQAFLNDLEPVASMRVDVVDDRGILVASRDGHPIVKTRDGDNVYGDRIRAHRPLVLEGSMAELAPGRSPETALTAMAPLHLAPWGVVIQQPNAQALSGVIATSRGLIASGLALAIAGVVLARTLSRSIVTPIRQLSSQAEAMRSGDLTSAIAITGDHEISVLAQTLDEARQRLAAALGELQLFNHGLEEQVAARTRVIVQQDEQRKVLLRRMLGATEEERRRLARELHDEIAQLLTVIQLSLHNLPLESPDVVHANVLLAKAQEEVHRIIRNLRPSLLDDLGLAAAIGAYADEHLRREGLRVSMEIDEDVAAGPEIETVIFRIFQELATNILRHAKAEQASIQLFRRERTLVLAVEDDGQGFEPESKAHSAGLTGMRERAALVNGAIRFDSEMGLGTHVAVEIPLP
jgi:signal transduction histidine kinase